MTEHDLVREARLIRGQAVSGLVFGLFLGVHLANAAAAALGPASYDGFLHRVRSVYQLPPVELLGVGASALIHIGFGVRRALARRRAAVKPAGLPTWLRIHRLCGWFLAFVIVGHVAATRGPGLFLGLPADLSYLRFSLETWPVLMVPYYVALYSAGCYHLLHGAMSALNVAGLSTPAPTARSARALLLLALGVGLVAVATMAGWIGPEIDTSRYADFRAMYERYLPFLVTW
jgi:succinate dehydrogenase/fumarate reductase cytochrome b subunit